MPKPYSVSVMRSVGHPFTNDFGWDLMWIKCIDIPTEDKMLDMSEERGWKLYMTGWDGLGCDQLRMMMFMRPSNRPGSQGDCDSWADPHPWPEPEDW